MKQKQCYLCKALLPVTEFNKSKKNKDWLFSYCKVCQSDYNHKYWELRKMKPKKVVVVFDAPKINSIYITLAKWLIVIILIVLAGWFVLSLGK